MISRRGFFKGLISVASCAIMPAVAKGVVTEKETRLKVVCDESQIANFISVSFDGIEYSNGFWFRDGRTHYTEPAFDKESIRKYGMRMKFVCGGPLTLEQANSLRDVYLTEHSWPFYSVSIER